MKQKFTLSFFDANPLILFCVIFAVGIIINGILINGLVLSIILGNHFTFGFGHLIDTATLSAAPVLTIILFSKIPLFKYFNDDDCSPWIIVPVHYLISCALLFLFGIVLSIIRFEPVPINALFSTVFIYSQIYVAIVILSIVIEVRKMAKVNSKLKKLQESQKRKMEKI